MKVLKNINNNIALCEDSNGCEVIAFGKGIGFIKPPNDVPLSRINRTFYNVKDYNYGTLKEIPTRVIDVSIQIIDHASSDLDVDFRSAAVLTLADHISFAIDRLDQDISLDMPIQENVKQLYPKELREAYEALALIERELHCALPKSEAAAIALHLVNNQENMVREVKVDEERIVEECIGLIEENFDCEVDRSSFSCSRFITHLDYLLRRGIRGDQLGSSNEELFERLKDTYPRTCMCVNGIALLLEKEMDLELNDEENLYLLLHVNRLLTRENN